MNVCLAGYQAVSILHGGPNTQIRKTAENLSRYGVNVTYFDPWAPFRKQACDLFHIVAANIGTYHLAREIHELGVPLVVSPIIYSLHSAAFIRWALAGTRILQKMGRGIWSDYALCADVCMWAGSVLPNSQAEADLVANGLGIGREKMRIVPNGVDERFYRADPGLFKKQYGLENFILNVGHVGQERKNVLALLRALGQIDHPAVIIGRVFKGEYGDACLREAAKHKHILLLDAMAGDSEMLASAFAACEVFALPSLFETPGIAALEAGLAGAKIVITPHGGPKEYFGDMAEYVDPRSVSAIREGIVRALNRKKDTQLQEHIRSQYLWQRVAEKTADAYRFTVGG